MGPPASHGQRGGHQEPDIGQRIVNARHSYDQPGYERHAEGEAEHHGRGRPPPGGGKGDAEGSQPDTEGKGDHRGDESSGAVGMVKAAGDRLDHHAGAQGGNRERRRVKERPVPHQVGHRLGKDGVGNPGGPEDPRGHRKYKPPEPLLAKRGEPRASGPGAPTA